MNALTPNFVLPSDPIERLNLSIRCYRALSRAKITTIGNLLEVIDSEKLLKIPMIGEKLKEEINVQIAQVKLLDASDRKIKDPPDIIPLQPDRKVRIPFEVLIWQSNLIQKQIDLGLLHQDAVVFGNTIGHWLSVVDSTESKQCFDIFASILGGSFTIGDELSNLLSPLPSSNVVVMVTRYGSNPKTLEAVGQDLTLTRERVRQIGVKLQKNLPAKTKSLTSTLKIQTALLIAVDMGLNISLEQWRHTIFSSGLVGKWIDSDYEDLDPLEVIIALCNLVSETIPELKLPNNLKQAIELASSGKPNSPARFARILKKLPKEIQKLIKRHSDFSGGVYAKWLAQETKIEHTKIKDILVVMGFEALSEEWFQQPLNNTDLEINKNHVFHHSLRKMFHYCGPLTIKDIRLGLHRSIARTSFPIPPTAIIQQILLSHSYKCEDELFYWDGESNAKLSSSEEVIWNCIKTNGPVVHHAQLAQAFIDSPLSFPALHAVLRRSPLFESFDVALYKLRGMRVTDQDIKRAEAASEWTPVNLEVAYKSNGNIEIESTLGILAIATGVVTSKQLPNLEGDWRCFVNNQEFRKLSATPSEFRNLGKTFRTLGCAVGDRVKFVFNTFERTVTITKFGE